MKSKNRLWWGAIILIIALVSLVLYYVLNKDEGDTTLSILDKKWIENNKDQIFDIAILNDLSIYGYEGKGVFFDFINDLETNTGLEFNKVPYVIDTNPSLGEYVYKVLPADIKADNNQIIIYEDNYVVLSKNNNKFNYLKDIDNYIIGGLNADLDKISYYLTNDNNLTYKGYSEKVELYEAFDRDEVNLIVLPYNLNLSTILKEDDYHIVFHLNELSRQYVLELNPHNERLSNIIKKYYNKWQNEKQKKIVDHFLFEAYLTNYEIDSATRNLFQSKRYTYGLVKNLPYEIVIDEKLIGINGEYLALFSDITGVEFSLVEYNNLTELNKALTNKKLDITFNYYNVPVTEDYVKVSSFFEGEYLLLGHNTNLLVVNSLKALKDDEVYVLKNSLIGNYLKGFPHIKVIEYKTIDELFSKLKTNSLIFIDSNIYNHYKNNQFNHYKVLLNGALNEEYTYLLKQTNENKVFNDLFNKFIATVNYKELKNKANIMLLTNPVRKNLVQVITQYILLIVLMGALLVYYMTYLIMRKKMQKKLKKEDKLKYTDMLTSLKNRNYLNDNIEKWEQNNTYPQAIVIVDLNNVKYVNDNYGHEEGDNLIKKAASILINTQLENSEIIRTDGNEFLIYLIGYTEQQVVLYTRKLYKEFKTLPHEFGSALGFSMIEDDIKTIDDAINEATLDMRTNKEEQKEEI